MTAVLLAKIIGYAAIILAAFFFIAVFTFIVWINRNRPEDWQ